MSSTESSLLSSSDREVEVSGRSKNIKNIDLGSVFANSDDARMLAAITSFDLSRNFIEHLTNLAVLTSLRKLDVSFNSITTVSDLPISITVLNIEHNKLYNLDVIGRLPYLQELNVCHNRLKTLDGLNPKMALKVLKADDNRLYTLKGIEHLPQLKILSVKNNFIDSIEAVGGLSACGTLQVLHLAGNPITRINGYRPIIARLQLSLVSLDGVPVLRRPSRDTSQISSQYGNKSLSLQDISVNSGAGPAAITMDVKGRRTPPLYGRVDSSAQTDRPITIDRSRVGPSSMAQEVSVESEEPIAEKRPPLPSSAPQVRFEEKNSYAKLHGRRQGSTPLPQRGGHEVDTPEPTPSAWTRQQELEREQLQRENQALRAKLKKSEDQLMEARRVISEQLGELSSLKAAKDASSRGEEDLKDRLQKLRRSAKLTESHHKDEVDTLRCQFERLKVFYESQIADLRRQLAVEMGRYPARGVSPRQRHHKGPHPAEAPVTPVSVNVSEASTTGRRPSEREAVGSEDLAEQLKGWLYAEMRGDLTKMEEERLLSEVRRSLRDDEGSSSRGQSPRALLESFIEKHAEYHSGKAEKGKGALNEEEEGQSPDSDVDAHVTTMEAAKASLQSSHLFSR